MKTQLKIIHILEITIITFIVLAIFFTVSNPSTAEPLVVGHRTMRFDEISYGMILMIFTFYTNSYLLLKEKYYHKLSKQGLLYIQIITHILCLTVLLTLMIEYKTTSYIFRIEYFNIFQIYIKQDLYNIFYNNVFSNVISGILLSITYYIYYRMKVPYNKNV